MDWFAILRKPFKTSTLQQLWLVCFPKPQLSSIWAAVPQNCTPPLHIALRPSLQWSDFSSRQASLSRPLRGRCFVCALTLRGASLWALRAPKYPSHSPFHVIYCYPSLRLWRFPNHPHEPFTWQRSAHGFALDPSRQRQPDERPCLHLQARVQNTRQCLAVRSRTRPRLAVEPGHAFVIISAEKPHG